MTLLRWRNRFRALAVAIAELRVSAGQTVTGPDFVLESSPVQLQEITVTAAAAFGDAQAGIINISTKGGGTSLAGNLGDETG